jgi:hypothetical protein
MKVCCVFFINLFTAAALERVNERQAKLVIIWDSNCIYSWRPTRTGPVNRMLMLLLMTGGLDSNGYSCMKKKHCSL